MFNINQQCESATNFTYLLKKSIKCVLLSYIISLFILLVFSVIITYSDLSEAYGNTIVKCTTYISIFAGSFICAMNTSKKGWMTGALTGLTYILILLTIGLFKYGFMFNINSLLRIALSVIIGAVGGIVGINIKSK